MLEKSLSSPADSVCYDLEDAVAPGKKADARRAVCELLDVSWGFLAGLGSELKGWCRVNVEREARSWLA